MSSFYFNYTFYIQDKKQRAKLSELINDDSDVSMKESLQKIGFLDCLDEYEFVESLKVTNKGLNMHQSGHKVNARLLLESKQLGCDFVHINIDYEETGEDRYYHRGKLVEKEHIDILLRVYNPEALASNKLVEQLTSRDLNALKLAINNGLDVNAILDEAPILHDVYTNRPVFHFLLDNGANPDVKDEYGYTVLMKILENNERENADIILSLLEKGANASLIMAEEGGSILWHAMSFGEKVIEAIKKHGGTYIRPDDAYQADDNEINVSTAIEHHDTENLNTFFQKESFDEDTISEFIETSITSNNITALELLLENGYDLLSKKNESTIIELLEKSLSYGSLEMARYLIDKVKASKFDLSEIDGDYIPEIATNPHATDILKILIPHSDAILTESPHSNGLVNVIQSNALENAKVLIEAGCILDDSSDEDFIIPILADNINEITAPMAQLLINAGADPYLKIHKSEDNFEENEDEINNNKSAIDFVLKEGKNKDPELVALFKQLQEKQPAEKQIWNLIEQGNLQATQSLFSQLSDTNIVNKNDKTLLHVAVQSEQLEVVKWLSQQDINLNHQDKEGNTAISNAVISENIAITKQLLSSGANANDKVIFPDENENSQEAQDKEDRLMDLMGLGVDNEIDKERERINSQLKMSGDDANCLMSAANSGNLQLVQLLLNNGAEIEAKDKAGRTAIFYSAENGHLSCVKYLHSKKAETEVHIKQKTERHEFSESFSIDFTDRHILEAAAYRGHIEVCNYLVKDCGIDINLKSKSTKHSAITSASLTGAFVDQDVMTPLLELGADVNSTVKEFTMSNASALHICMLTLNSRGAKLLIKHGADRDKLTIEGDTAYDILIGNLTESVAISLGFNLDELKPIKSATRYRQMIRRALVFATVALIPSAILIGIVYYFSKTWAMYLAIPIGAFLVWSIVSDLFSKDEEEETEEVEEHPFAAAYDAIENVLEENEKVAKKDKKLLEEWEEA